MLPFVTPMVRAFVQSYRPLPRPLTESQHHVRVGPRLPACLSVITTAGIFFFVGGSLNDWRYSSDSPGVGYVIGLQIFFATLCLATLVYGRIVRTSERYDVEASLDTPGFASFVLSYVVLLLGLAPIGLVLVMKATASQYYEYLHYLHPTPTPALHLEHFIACLAGMILYGVMRVHGDRCLRAFRAPCPAPLLRPILD
jgi:hypothetical protein